jgi:hypothetical protein
MRAPNFTATSKTKKYVAPAFKFGFWFQLSPVTQGAQRWVAEAAKQGVALRRVTGV